MTEKKLGWYQKIKFKLETCGCVTLYLFLKSILCTHNFIL